MIRSHRTTTAFALALLLAVAGAAMLVATRSGGSALWPATWRQVLPWAAPSAPPPRSAGERLDAALRLVQQQPAAVSATWLAAGVTAAGHWTFANRAGERFTASGPAELARVLGVLLPILAAPSAAAPTLVMTPDDLHDHRALIASLPFAANLRAVFGAQSFAVAPNTAANGAIPAPYRMRVRPPLTVTLTDPALTDEALALLAQPMSHGFVRVLALDPAGPSSISYRPRTEPTPRAIAADPINPTRLASALAVLAGQTVILTGRLADERLTYRTPDGAEASVPAAPILAEAARHDLTLIVVDSAAPRQPGTRNWLWQRVDVAGLEQAMGRATLADFLAALADGGGPLAITATRQPDSRLQLTALREDSAFAWPSAGTLGTLASEIVSEIAGTVRPSRLVITAPDTARRAELGWRIVRIVPAWLQFGYLGLLAIGVLGLRTAHGWWRRIWPPEQRRDYPIAAGYHAARFVRLALFVLIWLPLAAVPAGLVAALGAVMSGRGGHSQPPNKA